MEERKQQFFKILLVFVTKKGMKILNKLVNSTHTDTQDLENVYTSIYRIMHRTKINNISKARAKSMQLILKIYLINIWICIYMKKNGTARLLMQFMKYILI